MDFWGNLKLIWFLSCCLLSEQRNIYQREVVESLGSEETLRTPQKYIIAPVQTSTQQSDNPTVAPNDDVNFDDEEVKLNEIESKKVSPKSTTIIEPELKHDVVSETDFNESNTNKTPSTKICESNATIPYNSENQSSHFLSDTTTVSQNNSNSESQMKLETSESFSRSYTTEQIIPTEADKDETKETTNSETVDSTTENNFEVKEKINLMKSNIETASSTDIDSASIPTEDINPTNSITMIPENSENSQQPEDTKENDANSPTPFNEGEDHATVNSETKVIVNEINFQDTEKNNLTNNSVIAQSKTLLDATKETSNNNLESPEAESGQSKNNAASIQNVPEYSSNVASAENFSSPTSEEEPDATPTAISRSTTTAKPEITTEAAASFTTTPAPSSPSKIQIKMLNATTSTSTTTTTTTTHKPISNHRPVINHNWFPKFPPTRPSFFINSGGNVNTSVNSQAQSNYDFGFFALPSNWIPAFSSLFSPLNIIESRPPLHDVTSISTEAKTSKLWKPLVERTKSITDQIKASQVINGTVFRAPQLFNNRAQVALAPNGGQVLHFLFPVRFPLEGQIVSDTLRRIPAAKALERKVENQEAAYQAREILTAPVKNKLEDTLLPKAAASDGKPSSMFAPALPSPIVRFVKGIMETFMPSTN